MVAKVKNPKLVVIVGETASGKSALAIEVAKEFNGEIISADSWQVYKGFDIGTAKPTKLEQTEVKHHLVDIRQPQQSFSAALYKEMATKAINNVAKRNKLPVMVGGTGLYVDSVVYDFSFLPAGDPKQRSQLQALSIDELLQLLAKKQIDLTGIDLRNKRRLIRLLETAGQRPAKSATRENTLIIGIKLPRSQLRQRIEKRVTQMFKRGLRREVEVLAHRYGWEAEPMKGIGYAQFRPYFRAEQSLAQTRRKIVKATLELAKRQRTWFKRHREINWISSPADGLKMVKEFLAD
jgi:tRNA dimethylallyltransferase